MLQVEGPGAAGGGPDPLADPRCPELLGADPDEITDLARVFSVIGESMSDVSGKLGHIAAAPDWSGDAYGVMRSSIGELTPKLTTLSSGFTEVATAIGHYGGVVDTVQGEFKRVAKELTRLQASLASLTSTYSTESATLSTDQTDKSDDVTAKANKSTLKADGKAITKASDAASDTYTAMGTTSAKINELQPKGMALLDRFSDARSHVNTRVSGYAGQAPKAPGGFRPLHDVGDVIKAGIHGITSIPGEIVSIPDDIKNFAEHPTLANMEKLLKDSAIAAMTLSVAAGGASAVLDGAVEEVAGGSVDAAAEGGTDVAATTDGAVDGSSMNAAQRLNKIADGLDKTGQNLSTTGGIADLADGHVKDGIIDLLPVGKLSDKLNVGDASIDELKEQKDVLETVGKKLDGTNAGSVIAGLTDDQKATLESVGAVPITAKGADSLVSSTEQKLSVAEHVHNTTGRAVDLGQDNAVTDPTKDAVKDHLDGDKDEDSGKVLAGQGS